MSLQNKNCKILDVQHLSATIHPAGKAKAFKVLNDVSFDVRQGEILAIVGESGGGKSMLAKTLMHLLPANISIPYVECTATVYQCKQPATSHRNRPEW